MIRRPIACLALLAALLTGCAGREYRPGAKPVTAHWPGKESCYNFAPYPGEYALLRAGDDTPLATRELAQDTPVGFEVSPEGTLSAQVGKEAIPLEEGDYRWHVLRVSHGQRARLALGQCCQEASPYLGAAAVVCFVALLAGGALLLLSLLPDGSVHLS